jgi:thiamine-monophosphate kinase
MREFDFIDWVCRQGSFDPAVVEVGPGDDCAVLRCGGERLLVTTDQVLDGVHVIVARDGAAAAGRKAAARNLSDIAAMAGVPVAMVATVALPHGFPEADVQAIYRGLREVGDEFGCPVVGGDVAAWTDKSAPLQISVTVFGRCDGVEPVLRNGAQVGDAICVTGAVGGAWRSTRHLTFTPRLAEARMLAKTFRPTAMIDISDGLAADLGHICTASGVAAEIDASAMPIHPDVAGMDNPINVALHDGEDYELLFTLPADRADALLHAQPLGVKVSRIGTIIAGAGMTLILPDRRKKLEPRGWEHHT